MAGCCLCSRFMYTEQDAGVCNVTYTEGPFADIVNGQILAAPAAHNGAAAFARTYNGNLSGNEGCWVVRPGVGGVWGALGFDLLYTLSATVTGFMGVGYFNGWGGDLSDGDGVGGVSYRASRGGVLNNEGPVAIPNANNGNIHSELLSYPQTANAFHLYGFTKPYNGSNGAALREVYTYQRYGSTFQWNCGGNIINGVISGRGEGGQTTFAANNCITCGGRITYNAGAGTITQTGGPHDMIFSSPNIGDFEGDIVTNRPADFSSLNISKEKRAIVISGNHANTTFSINWRLTPDAADRWKFGFRDSFGVLRDAEGNPLVAPYKIIGV